MRSKRIQLSKRAIIANYMLAFILAHMKSIAMISSSLDNAYR